MAEADAKILEMQQESAQKARMEEAAMNRDPLADFSLPDEIFGISRSTWGRALTAVYVIGVVAYIVFSFLGVGTVTRDVPLTELQQVREKVVGRGGKDYLDIRRAFKNIDTVNSDSYLTKEEFINGLKNLGVSFKSSAQWDTLLDYFDSGDDQEGGDGKISLDEFIAKLKDNLTDKRKMWVRTAFNKFDANKSGTITVADFKGVYRATEHPEVKAGKKTEDEVFEDILKNFNAGSDGVITYDEFEQYYSAISVNVDKDETFVDLIKKSWGLKDEDLMDSGSLDTSAEDADLEEEVDEAASKADAEEATD